MVTWVVSIRIMAEVGRRPSVCSMAYVTLYSRGKVIGWFGRRITIRSMTSIAHTVGAGIVNPGTTNEGCSGMAGATIQVGRKVDWIGLGIFASCRHTMTRVAACRIGHGAVIER